MPEPTSSRRFWSAASSAPGVVTLVILTGTAAMAMNIYLPVLPLITDDLNTTDALAQYTLTFFLIATAFAQLIIGPLSDRFGRRPVLLGATGIYLIGTLMCIFAPSIEVLLFARVLQASSAASMSLSRAIIRDLFDREEAASMIGYVTMAMAVIPMVSPTIGGLVGEQYGWRAPFVVLLVIAVLTFFLIYTRLGETHTPRKNKVTEQISDYFQLLREPQIWGYFMVSSMNSGAYFAFLAGAPFIGLKVIGMTPAFMGLHFACLGIGYMAGNFLSGRYSQRVGIERMMFLGGLVSSIGVLITFFLMTSYEPHRLSLFLPMVLLALGNGLTLPNANAGGISVRPDLSGSASGLGGFLQIGGGALLATLSGMLLTLSNQGVPLYIIMLLTSLGGTILSGWMYVQARKH